MLGVMDVIHKASPHDAFRIRENERETHEPYEQNTQLSTDVSWGRYAVHRGPFRDSTESATSTT